MTLIPGTRLGAFEIITLIGAGGMGEVYRARDMRLGRDVALKVLPDAFAQDADRLSRFQREAQLLASLSHPNIAAIHGLEDTGGVRALILELIHGETLSDRLGRGAMPAEEAVTAARQIAEALEAAHERGVIHRDLKPANIKIAADGAIKVLDFGLAKAMEPAPVVSHLTHSPTLSLAGTFAGVILGTAAYMSPEQAKGLPADQRSDIFSFGCVLYEMLTARQAFQADTVSELLAAVLLRDPDLEALPKDIHPRLADLVRRCLDKNPKRRWQAIGDVRFELDAIAAHPRGHANQSGAAASPAPKRSPLPSVAWLVATAAVVAAVAMAATRWTARPAEAPLVARFSMLLPADQSLLRLPAPTLAISPDGTKVVYAANRQLFVRAMSDMTAHPIPGTALDATAPFFSPDGRWLGFFAFQDLTIKKIAVTGGAAFTVTKAEPIAGADWQGDQIVFAQPKGMIKVSANGGEPETIAKVASDELAFGPRLIDRGTALLYTVTKAGLGFERWDKAQIVVERIGSGQRTVVVRGGSDARYLPTGHLVYAVAGSILAIPFDLGKKQTTGGPVPVVESVLRVPNSATQMGIAHFATSANGALAYLLDTANGPAGPKLLSLVDRDGKTQPIALPPQMYVHPRLSPDGTQIAVGTDDGRDADVWIYDRKNPGASARRLTFGGRNRYPIWSPDGRYIAFQSDREGDGAIFRQLASGSGAAERLTKPDPGAQHEPESWSPDGTTLSFNNVSGNNQGVWTVKLDGDRKPVVFADSVPDTAEKHSMFSPDGHWIAYMAAPVSTIAVNTEVFVQPFPASDAKYQVSTGGGRTPRWSSDGKALFYHEPTTNRFFVVDVQTTPSLTFGRPTPLPIEGTIHPLAQRNYDVTPDGRQLLVVVSATPRTAESSRAQQINVVLNWFEELRAHMPVTK